MAKTTITCSDSVYQFIKFLMTVLFGHYCLTLLCFFFILAGYELNKNITTDKIKITRCISGLKPLLPYCSGSL